MTTKHKTTFLLLMCLLCGLPAWADDYFYLFDEQDWVLKNSGTINTDGEGNKLEITGANIEDFNIAVKYYKENSNKYGLAATQCYFTVVTVTDKSLHTEEEKCKLFCINGKKTDDYNVQPDYVVSEGGKNIYVWDISKLNGFNLTEGVTLHDETAFALTSSSGSATITDINFYTATELTENYPAMASMNLPFLFDETSIANDLPKDKDGVSNATVKVVRKLKAGNWNTFCVPFGMSGDQLPNNITEVRKLTSSIKNGENITLTFEKVSTVEAGVPYIVKVASELSELNVSGVTVSPSMTDVTTEHVVMTGNYQATTVPQGSYFISSDKFYLADTDKVSLKGFRAYVSPKSEIGAANVLAIDLYDGGETSAREVQRGGVRYVDVYNMSGVCLRTAVDAAHALDGLPAGEIYLIEGTKILKTR